MSNKTKSEYPAWICLECGLKYGNKTTGNHDCTWHPDTCGVCGEKTIVTEPRDFGHLKPGWEKLSPSEGQGAPCPEAVNHGDALDCSPFDEDHLPIMDLSIKEIAEILNMPIPKIRDTVNKIRIENK